MEAINYSDDLRNNMINRIGNQLYYLNGSELDDEYTLEEIERCIDVIRKCNEHIKIKQ